METIDALTVARGYHDAWTSKNFELASDLLSEDLKIEVPINSYKTKQEFLEAVKFTCQAVTGINILSELSNKDEAILLYDMQIPSMGNLRIVEHFTITNGKIVQIRHIHDTAPFREAGFKPNNV